MRPPCPKARGGYIIRTSKAYVQVPVRVPDRYAKTTATKPASPCSIETYQRVARPSLTARQSSLFSSSLLLLVKNLIGRRFRLLRARRERSRVAIARTGGVKTDNPPPNYTKRAATIDSWVRYRFYPAWLVILVMLIAATTDRFFKSDSQILIVLFAVLQIMLATFSLLVLAFTLLILLIPSLAPKILKHFSDKWRRPVNMTNHEISIRFIDRYNKDHRVIMDFTTYPDNNFGWPVPEEAQAFFNSYFQAGGIATSYAALESLLEPKFKPTFDAYCLIWAFRIRSIEPPLAFFDDMPIGDPI